MKFTIDTQMLVLAVSAVIPAASKDRHRPNLCGVHLDLTDGTLAVVATNGSVLACYDKLKVKNADTGVVTIATKSAKTFVKEFKSTYGELTITVNSAGIVECGNKIMSLDIINDVYPDWLGVVPTGSGGVNKICFSGAVLKVLVQCFENFPKNKIGTQNIIFRHTGDELDPVVCTLDSIDYQQYFIVIMPCRI